VVVSWRHPMLFTCLSKWPLRPTHSRWFTGVNRQGNSRRRQQRQLRAERAVGVSMRGLDKGATLGLADGVKDTVVNAHGIPAAAVEPVEVLKAFSAGKRSWVARSCQSRL
jgi:hypothetical protein